jgi:hypothetical protein
LENWQVLDLIELEINLFRDLIEEILKFGVKIAKIKSKDYIENGAQIQGGIYSLNQGLNYKTFKTSRAKMKITIKHKKGAISRHYSSSSTVQPPTATITPTINGWNDIVLWL